MGSENGFSDEKPTRRGQISKPLYLGRYPVTQRQWAIVMGNNPSYFKGDSNRPMEKVSWNDVQEFLRKLSEQEKGKAYRLPTEAEWEYACRAGPTGAYCFGDDDARLKEYAWYRENSGGTTHPVGQLKPNDWGLYDMHSNVWEWVQDYYGENYYKQRPNPDIDPQGLNSGQFRSARGGSWMDIPLGARASGRLRRKPSDRSGNVGFRCACEFSIPADRVLSSALDVGIGGGLG